MNDAFRVLFGAIFLLLLLVLVLATAQANGLIVFSGTGLDLAAIILSAVSVLITGLGVFIAILALWGYKEIRDRATNAAVEEATKRAVEAAREAAKPIAARTALEYMKDVGQDGEGSVSDEDVAQIVEALEPENENHG